MGLDTSHDCWHVNTYGRHSMENTPPNGPIIDEVLLMMEYHGQGKHRLSDQLVTQLSDLEDLVYYSLGKKGFVRATKPFELIS